MRAMLSFAPLHAPLPVFRRPCRAQARRLLGAGLLALAGAAPWAQASVAATAPLPATLPAGGQPAVARPENATQPLSAPAAELVRWVAQTDNHGGRPYVVVDKQRARVWLFDAQHRLQASSAALLGLTVGDHEVSDIRSRNVATLAREARITPAGRFVTEPGVNLQGEDVVWLDYEAGLAMHRVRPGVAQASRLKRLAGGVASEQRVSLGCVVLPVAFYEQAIRPVLGRRAGVVYVLPEREPLSAWLPRWSQATSTARAS